MTNKPLVTVIIPTYNRVDYISRSINSVLNQTYKNIELIVIDDGSTDHTASVVSEFKNIKYVYKPNGRQASARNAGLALAKGSYIATLDSDDYWHSDFIEECITQLLEFELDLVFANTIIVNENGSEHASFDQADWSSKYYNSSEYLNLIWIHLNGQKAREIFTKTCPAPSSALVFNRNSISHLWDEKLAVADDWDFTLTLLVSKDCKIAFCKKPLWRKYIVGDNIYESLSSEAKTKIVILNDLSYMMEKNKEKYSTYEKLNIKTLQIQETLVLSYNMLRHKNFINFAKLIILSFKMSIPITTKKLTKTICSRIFFYGHFIKIKAEA
jgi:glycosyltransferase involved in cell wall biosynthesis